jgi:hypothetical protein
LTKPDHLKEKNSLISQPPQNKFLYRQNKTVSSTGARALANSIIHQYIHSVSSPVRSDKPFTLGSTIVHSVCIDKPVFFIYDTHITYDPMNDWFYVKILMELPPIKIFISSEYSKYYPLINPYIHMIETTYRWQVKKDGMLEPTMHLEKLDICMVDWQKNRYWNTYIQTINSPIKVSDMPSPISWSKDELTAFLLQTNLFITLSIPIEEDFHAKTAPHGTTAIEQ